MFKVRGAMDRQRGSAPMITVLVFVVAVSLTLGAFLMLSNTALTKNQATRSDDFSAQLEAKLEQALADSLASYGTATTGPGGVLPGTAILETSEVELSDTAVISKVEGSNPWVATITDLESTDQVVSGANLKASSDSGSLPGGCVVLQLLNSSSLTCSTETRPTTGSVKDVVMDDYVDCSPDPLSTSSGAISIICTPFDGSGSGVFFAEEGLVLTGVLPSSANGVPDESKIGSDYGLKVTSIQGKAVAVANDVRNYSDAWSGNLKLNSDVLVPSKPLLRTSPGLSYSVSGIQGSSTIVLTTATSHDIKVNEPMRVTGKTSQNADCEFVARASAVTANSVSYSQSGSNKSPCTPSSSISVRALPDICISYSSWSQLTDIQGTLVSCQSKEKIDISDSFYFKALQKAVDDSASRVNSKAATVDQGNFPRCTGLTINTATSVLTVNDSPVSARTLGSNRRVLIVKLNSQVDSQLIAAGSVLNVTRMTANAQGDWGRFNGSLTVNSFTLKSSSAFVDEITFNAITTGSTNSLPAAGVTYNSNSGSTAITLKSDGASGSSLVTLTVKGINLVTGRSKQVKIVGFPSPTTQNPAPTGTVAGNALNASWNLLTLGAPIEISGAPKGVSTQTLQFIYPHTLSGGQLSAGTLWVTTATVVEDYQGNPWQDSITPHLSLPAGIYNQSGIAALNSLTGASGTEPSRDPYGIACPSRPSTSAGQAWELRMNSGDYHFQASPGTKWNILDTSLSIVNGPNSGKVLAKTPPEIKLLKLIARGKQLRGGKNTVTVTVQLAEKNPYAVGSRVSVSYRLKDGKTGRIPASGDARVTSADKQGFTIVVPKNDVPPLNQLDEYSMTTTGVYFECDYSGANPPPATGETTSAALASQLKSYDDGLLNNPNGVQLNFKENVGISAGNSSVMRLCPISYVTKPKVSIAGSFTQDNGDVFLSFTNGAKLILGGQLLAPKSRVVLSEGSSTSSTATMSDLMLLGGMVVKAASITVSGGTDGSIAIQQPTYFQGSGRKFLLKASVADKTIAVKKSLCAVVSVDDGYGAKKGNKLTVSSVVKC